MGRIFDRFGLLKFHNEAEVSQNFLIPLLTEFLGYELDEILPERFLPITQIPLNRNKSVSTVNLEAKAKPDYLVTLKGTARVFLCDSKAPNENLDSHISQVVAYCIASQLNLLLITNGHQLRVYFANSLVLDAQSIGELDQRFSELYKLLGRSQTILQSDLVRLQKVDLKTSLSSTPDIIEAQHLQQIAIANSEFSTYLQEIIKDGDSLQLPETVKEAFNFDLQRFPADKLYILQDIETESGISKQNANVPYRALFNDANPMMSVIIIGDSGIGKTHLLQQILSDQTSICLEFQSTRIPILIKLGTYNHAHSLFDLVRQVLLSRGVHTDDDYINQLLIDGRVLFLLDAFDEVFDEYITDVEKEIQLLLDLYPKCQVIITTRHFRVPQLQFARRYQLSPLSESQIADFSKLYLNNEASIFLEHLLQRHLYRAASNTLLLTLLILLYRSNGSLPTNRGQILQAVVDGVRVREKKKSKRFKTQLGWEVREKLLSRLAFKSVSQGKSYALDQQSVEEILLDDLDSLQKIRQIPHGLTIPHVKEMLAATGFVSNIENGIIFWHHSFLEYFAAFELLRQGLDNPKIINQLVHNPAWEDIFPLMALNTVFSLDVIEEIYKHNIFCAARILIDAGVFSGHTYEKICDGLYMRCTSTLVSIRQIATNLLKRMEGEYVNTLFLRLLESEFNDVQIPVLVEVARRRLPQAHQIVFSRLDWSVPHELQILGTSVTAVIQALSEFDDEVSHLQIVAFWRKEPDIWTDFACRESLIALAKRNILTKRVKQEILEFFLMDFKDSFDNHKYWSLGDVLIAIGEKEFAPQLISKMTELSDTHSSSQKREIVQILSSYNDNEIATLLFTGVNNKKLDIHSRRLFAQALCGTKTHIPITVFEELVQDEDYEINSYGIYGLSQQLPFEQIKDVVLNAVHPPTQNQDQSPHSEFHFVQKVAIEILAQNGQLELLLQDEHTPKYIYENALEVIYKTIRQDNLRSMLPIARALGKQNPGTRIAIWSAWLLADFGQLKEAQKMVETAIHQSRDGRTTSDILAGIHRLPSDYALAVIDSFLTDAATIKIQHDCIEALGNVGTQAACDRLANIASAAAKSNDGAKALRIEEAIRAMGNFAPRDKEDWLIELLEIWTPERLALRRAIELLGLIGSTKSLNVLEKYLVEQPIYIQDTAFWAIKDIHRRNGVIWYHDEEYLSLNN